MAQTFTSWNQMAGWMRRTGGSQERRMTKTVNGLRLYAARTGEYLQLEQARLSKVRKELIQR